MSSLIRSKFNGFGLIVPKDNIDYLCNKVYEQLTEEQKKEYGDSIAAFELEDSNFFRHQLFLASDVIEIDFTPMGGSKSKIGSEVLCVFTFKQPKIIGTAYNNKKEIHDEIKEEFADFLPENFNWKQNIGWFSGVSVY